MFVLFTLFKLTLDERKTLTKISTRKPLTAVPNGEKAGCIIGGESRGIRISSRNNESIKNTTELVLYKTLHYFVPD